MIFVEVKRKSSYFLKNTQMRFMQYLSKHGVKCYRWSPDIGFETIKPGAEYGTMVTKYQRKEDGTDETATSAAGPDNSAAGAGDGCLRRGATSPTP